jgi:hypothetical protein
MLAIPCAVVGLVALRLNPHTSHEVKARRIGYPSIQKQSQNQLPQQLPNQLRKSPHAQIEERTQSQVQKRRQTPHVGPSLLYWSPGGSHVLARRTPLGDGFALGSLPPDC